MTLTNYGTENSSGGASAVAGGARAVAVGNDASASGEESTAIGNGARATGTNSLALSADYTDNATASGQGSVAIGHGGASGQFAITMSPDPSYNAGIRSIVLGKANIPAGSGSKAFSVHIDTHTNSYGGLGTNSVALGKEAKSSGTQSFAAGGWRPTATGTQTVAIGSFSSASAVGAVAISTEVSGYYTQAQGSQSVCIGDRVKTTQQHCFALGNLAKSDVVGKYVYASGMFANEGDAQAGQFVLRCNTTDATATDMTTNGATMNQYVDNFVHANSDTCLAFSGLIIAMQNGAQDQGAWEIKGILKNDGGTTTLVNSNIQTFDTGNGWTIALSADNSLDALKIAVTGEAAHNIRWVANIKTSEVTYA
tara:strand:+ start:3129 stop:4229 length:1101 start_codon:yes stop_codon:yes gene_type:complete